MALALYRKYRPRTFAEVIGQEHVTEPLTQALRTGRLHHAYLFSGPRGCGKTSSARILARSLNCAQGPTPDPCGECESCRALAPDGPGSIDVIEIDAASHGGVDDARELRERAIFAPASSRFKVYVIDEAHMVSSAGFNALLKLVEEPPDYVKFVFATTEPEKVLGTIKSRTHHYPFRLIPPGVLRPYLEQLTVAEGVTVEPAVFPLVVRAGGGSARDALSVLDQLIAGAGPEGVTYQRAVALLGVTDVALIDEMCDALAAGDGATAFAVIDRVVEAGHDPRRFASDLLERLRDLIVLQQVPDAVTKGLLDAPEDELERMTAQASHLGAATLSRFADIVHNGLTEMRGTTAPRLLLELICARMLLPGAEDSTGALLQRLERMERRLTAGGAADEPTARLVTPAPAPASAPTPAPAPTSAPPVADRTPVASSAPAPASAVAEPAPPAKASAPPEKASAPPAKASAPPAKASAPPAEAPTPPTGRLDGAAVRRVWSEVLALVSGKSKKAAALVREAAVRDVEGDTLVLLFRHSWHASNVANSPTELLEALHELLGGEWQVRCEVGEPGSGQATAPPRQVTPPSTPPSGGATPELTVPGGAAPEADDWPAPARPGGTGSASHLPSGSGPGGDGSAVPSASMTQERPAEDWPTPARPGGTPQPGGNAQPDSTAQAGTATTVAAARAVAPAKQRPASRRGSASTPKSGMERARAAASRAGSAQRKGPAESAWDGTGADEPPFDPDFDGPTPAARYPGFDPGDEPLDDGDPQVRETSEEAALRLLSEALGAEKISESGG